VDVIAYLHDQGHTHRDIKPANVMLRSDGEPILLDLGVLSDEVELQEYTGSQIFLGTLRFASPEWLLAVDCTSATDVYSLGTVLFQILTGKPIFSEIKLYSRLVNAVQHENPIFQHPENDVDRLFLTLLCKKMLRKDPIKRPNLLEIEVFSKSRSQSPMWNLIRCEILMSLFKSYEFKPWDSLLEEASQCDSRELDVLISVGELEQILELGKLRLLLKPSSIQTPLKHFLSLDIENKAEWLRLLFEGIHGEEGSGSGSAIEACCNIADQISKSCEKVETLPKEVKTILENAKAESEAMWRAIALENP
jgi:serine/threonine protein kinase